MAWLKGHIEIVHGTEKRRLDLKYPLPQLRRYQLDQAMVMIEDTLKNLVLNLHE